MNATVCAGRIGAVLRRSHQYPLSSHDNDDNNFSLLLLLLVVVNLVNKMGTWKEQFQFCSLSLRS
jgi:hypothetical protein